MAKSIPMADARAGTIPVFALACGIMVANIYLCQPLLAQIAQAFGVSPGRAALVAVLTQVGYTIGILFVVPLADTADPVRLLNRLLSFTIVGLSIAALSPHLGLLLAASLAIATTSVVAQILIPLATTLTTTEYRGRVVSALSTGLIMGILLSRTVSGISAELAGTWRAPYILEAALVIALRVALPRFLPAPPPRDAGQSYTALLRSLSSLLRFPELRLSMTLSACTFAAFSAIWASLAFHLATPAFGLGAAAAGLFGLWGAPGALLAPIVGRMSDRWGPTRVNVISLMALAACLATALLLGGSSLAGLVLMVNLLDFGQQSGQVANQARIFGLNPQIRARLNTLYMVATFAGGSIGAAAGGLAWTSAGWGGVCLLACGLVAIAAVVLLLTSVLTKRRQLPINGR